MANVSHFNTDISTPFATKIQCHIGECAIDLSLYDYRPSIAVNLLFLILFSIAAFIHLTQLLFWPKLFFSCTIVIGCVLEIAGYSARIISNSNPFALTPYFLQFIGLTIAPAFFNASIYGCLGEITNSLGPQLSRLRPKIYTITFVISDIISFFFQGIGGFLCLYLLLSGRSDGQTGINVVLIGLGYQILSLIVFIYLGVEFVLRLKRYKRNQNEPAFPSGQLKVFLVFFCLAVSLLFVRCIYRFAELSGGLQGRLLHDQTLFIFLEGMLMIISVFALNLGHPGMLPPRLFVHEGEKFESDLSLNPTPVKENFDIKKHEPYDPVLRPFRLQSASMA